MIASPSTSMLGNSRSSAESGALAAAAFEYIDKGITVNHVPPGFIDTPLVRESDVDVEVVAAMTPMKRAALGAVSPDGITPHLPVY
ncbi:MULTISPECIES: hypothetical protein [Streptomyces]|uniref:hypothetical protein n=1 Tax=Streptomyces TaxID=1883 RepID=UPI0033A1BFE6